MRGVFDVCGLVVFAAALASRRESTICFDHCAVTRQSANSAAPAVKRRICLFLTKSPCANRRDVLPRYPVLRYYIFRDNCEHNIDEPTILSSYFFTISTYFEAFSEPAL